MSDSRPIRRSARILVIDSDGRLLLFRFTPKGRPAFWGTPGGALNEGESFEEAAGRELFEETGIKAEVDREVDRRESLFTTFNDIEVRAVERYFAVRVDPCELDASGHTDEEREWMLTHRWWTQEELAALDEAVYPPDILSLWASELEKS